MKLHTDVTYCLLVLYTEGSVSSGDEFVNYDSEEEENKRVNNMVIICGPHGCGKTSTVYALASELGYKVS